MREGRGRCVKPGVTRCDASRPDPLHAHAQARPCIRRHRLRRLAAAGGRRLDPGADRRRAAADSRAAPVTVHGAGRTDAGVHALGAGRERRADRARSTTRALARGAQRGAAADRPRHRVVEMPPTISTRVQRDRKTYEYRIVERARSCRRSSAATPGTCRAARPRRDARRPRRRSSARHDFAAFQGTGSVGARTVRTITRARHGGRGGRDAVAGRARSRATGSCATWCGAWSGRWSRSARAAGRRRDIGSDPGARAIAAQAGRTAPARGLFLAAAVPD